MTLTATPPPVLPPAAGHGAFGIPIYERYWLAAGVRLAARFYTKDRITAMFRAEAEYAVDLAHSVTEAQGRQRVRIARLVGIERSSCEWSVYMTLEHLVLANSAIAAMLPRLYAGRALSTSVAAVDVKPVADAGPEQVEALLALVDRYTDMVDKLGNLRAGGRCRHPWFGTLSAAQWHSVATIHNSTHRRQIARIISRL